jgi:hypothetical protein
MKTFPNEILALVLQDVREQDDNTIGVAGLPPWKEFRRKFKIGYS